MRQTNITYIIIATLLICSCSTTKNFNNYDDQYAQKDPFEKVNRVIFKFNHALDRAIVRPTAKGYRAVTNQYTRDRVRNFFSNLAEPVHIINHGLQGELKDTSVATGRLVVNTTVGLLGLYDVASKIGLEKNNNRFDQTLEKWCIDEGPYLMLPFIGPSTPRGMVGIVGDGFMTPVYWATRDDNLGGNTTFYGSVGAAVVIAREHNMEVIDDVEKNSVDLYAALRSIYYQNRPQNKCSKHLNENNHDFDFDFDEEE
jgi:phospholipid-binding lipoprotein MlaA